MIAEIIAAGSEMLTPHRQDTNSLFLTAGLNKLGVSVAFKTIVGDNFQHLTSAAAIAIRRTDIIIFSGGLGPTEDDLTREAVAGALGIDERTVLMSTSAPRSRAVFEARGLRVVAVDIGEFEKLEGCVTCLSVRLRG